jgi:hypothetical protein
MLCGGERNQNHIYICEHKSAPVMKYLLMEAEDSIISVSSAGFI